MKNIASLFLAIIVLSSRMSHAATWYLQDTVPGANWNTLTNWYSQPLNGGTHPTSINPSDNFDLNGYRVYTPAGSSGTVAFGGNQLILHGGWGGILLTTVSGSAVLSIPTLVSHGGWIANSGTGNQFVNITSLTSNANTTFSANPGKAFSITIGTLSGNGDICAIGTGGTGTGGAINLNVTTATGFTGTFHIATGCQFTFGQAMTSGGALDVDSVTSQTTVNLNYTVTFKGLTINGVEKPPGTYSVVSLGLPFSGTGSIVVQPSSPTVSNVTEKFGVNLPGGGFSSGSFYPTDPNEWSYYQSKGLNLIRVAFLWERLQPTLNGPLDPTALASLDSVVSLAAARGMSVILDMHNYGRYKPAGGTTTVIGSGVVTYAAYQNAWQQLAAHFVTQPGIYGYDIMNEPHGNGNPSTWNTTAAQYGVNGVRQSDAIHYVIVEGNNYSGAQTWMIENADLNVTDSANKLIYSAHTYWDSDNSGVYAGTYDSNNVYPNIGEDRAAQFVYWLGLKGAKGYIGEFGVPNNVAAPDYRWNIALDNFLSYLNRNGVQATYWSGGESWGTTYPLSCATGTPPADAPAMTVLQEYGSTPLILDVAGSTGITLTGSWSHSTATNGYYGSYYLTDNNAGGGKSVKFTPTVATAGAYEVYAWWTATSNRASNVPISVVSASGTTPLTINQKINGGQWVSLGTYTFSAGTGGSVTISDTGANGYVIANAVEFVPVPPVILSVSGLNGVTLVGSWTQGMSTPGRYGNYYLSDGGTGGGHSVQFTPDLPTTANYQVYIWWTAASNRASNVPIDIVSATGTTTVTVNQQVNGGQWVSLGTYAFNAGTTGTVTIGDTGANGTVIANAIQFVPQ